MALRTPLYDWHAAHGATFVPFAGYDMPVHYGSIKEEHATVRNQVGLFDVSHMSNLWLEGKGAAAVLARTTPSDPTAVPLGKGKYTVFLNADGTILDDAFYFKLNDEKFYIVPNAGRNEAIAAHLRAHGKDCKVTDVSADTAIFALQGAKGKEAFAAITSDPAPKFHHLTTLTVAGVSCMASGTGYTGEKGCELYVPAKDARKVWEHIINAAGAYGIKPIGLGARDTLRLEKAYCLAGNEFEGGRTPVEAGLDWAMVWGGDFLGKERLQIQKDSGQHDKLVGLVQQTGIPRHGYTILRDGKPVGKVTSGTQSPNLGTGIALGYIRGGSIGDKVQVEVRGKPMDATIVKTPFV